MSRAMPSTPRISPSAPCSGDTLTITVRGSPIRVTHFDFVNLLGTDVERILEAAAPMAAGQQREIGTAEQIFLAIAPDIHLAVDVGKPLLGIESVDHVIGVLEQIFQVLLGFLDFPRPLPDLDFRALRGRFGAAVPVSCGR